MAHDLRQARGIPCNFRLFTQCWDRLAAFDTRARLITRPLCRRCLLLITASRRSQRGLMSVTAYISQSEPCELTDRASHFAFAWPVPEQQSMWRFSPCLPCTHTIYPACLCTLSHRSGTKWCPPPRQLLLLFVLRSSLWSPSLVVTDRNMVCLHRRVAMLDCESLNDIRFTNEREFLEITKYENGDLEISEAGPDLRWKIVPWGCLFFTGPLLNATTGRLAEPY